MLLFDMALRFMKAQRVYKRFFLCLIHFISFIDIHSVS